MEKKFKVKKGDTVVVIAGKDKGKKGEIQQIITKKDRAIINGINIVKKHEKSKDAQTKKPKITEEAAPIDISNIMFYCSKCDKGVRVGYKTDKNGKKQRFCKKCETILK